MSEYYKSLISDEEVIQALIKESKRREGTLTTESSRLKPNLNFFQRTVNNLVSNNKRIDKSVTNFKGDYLKLPKTHTKPHRDKPKRLPINHAYEKQLFHDRKINFTKPISIEKEGRTKKPYQSSSIRKSNKSLLKYIEELSTDSSDSESPEHNANDSTNTENIAKRSMKTKNLSQKYIKIDEISSSDSERESIEKCSNDTSASNTTFKDIPEKYLKSEDGCNKIICISSDSDDDFMIHAKKVNKKKK
ncbi:unnamed protein product [Ceutorhynchus assimilis]|uniref:Uncharacterized protein n=1 Tax=Ceutorhynchus assimilis TaxID=467358 RepID=A0A9N9MQV8_9CUCU|nr:unnamed protein product [Ceutorhynchus assimilis]